MLRTTQKLFLSEPTENTELLVIRAINRANLAGPDFIGSNTALRQAKALARRICEMLPVPAPEQDHKFYDFNRAVNSLAVRLFQNPDTPHEQAVEKARSAIFRHPRYLLAAANITDTARWAPYTLADVIDAIKEHVRHEILPPSTKSERVRYGRLAGVFWPEIHANLRAGRVRGAPAGTTLASVKDQLGLTHQIERKKFGIPCAAVFDGITKFVDEKKRLPGPDDILMVEKPLSGRRISLFFQEKAVEGCKSVLGEVPRPVTMDDFLVAAGFAVRSGHFEIELALLYRTSENLPDPLPPAHTAYV